MKNITLFMSDKCPHCPVAIEKLEKEGIEFNMVNITNSISELKEFLKYRDTEQYFEKLKEEGYIGIPTILTEDGKFYNPLEIEDFSIFK